MPQATAAPEAAQWITRAQHPAVRPPHLPHPCRTRRTHHRGAAAPRRTVLGHCPKRPQR
ncbi:hypothetical protein [Nocardia sp. NPDC059239]|uniref:hypothetical protein n=1 Tax=unclassified Nocardia TaxID=2637762 RepID=UPI003691739C